MTQRPDRPFGNKRPFDTATGKYAPLGIPVGTVRRFVIFEVFDDYLKATDGTIIAKPFLLRWHPFDGKSVEYPDKTVTYTYPEGVFGQRTATVEGVDEVQTITPMYYVGEEIFAVKTEHGIEVHSYDAGVPMSGCQWVDLNTAGRAWSYANGGGSAGGGEYLWATGQ